jgi:hypothetical protein
MKITGVGHFILFGTVNISSGVELIMQKQIFVDSHLVFGPRATFLARPQRMEQIFTAHGLKTTFLTLHIDLGIASK